MYIYIYICIYIYMEYVPSISHQKNALLKIMFHFPFGGRADRFLQATSWVTLWEQSNSRFIMPCQGIALRWLLDPITYSEVNFPFYGSMFWMKSSWWLNHPFEKNMLVKMGIKMGLFPKFRDKYLKPPPSNCSYESSSSVG